MGVKWNFKRFVNLTPHDCTVYLEDTIRHIPPSGNVVRLNSHCKPCGVCDGIPVAICAEGDPIGLPEPEDGTIYIVSSMIAKKVKRLDVLCPDTSDKGVIRDGNGYILGVRGLQLFQ